LPPYGPLGNILLHLGYVVVGYTSERHGTTLPELTKFSLSIIIFILSRTTNVAAGEHMVPGPFHLQIKSGLGPGDPPLVLLPGFQKGRVSSKRAGSSFGQKRAICVVQEKT
jgi:hypothetical protein